MEADGEEQLQNTVDWNAIFSTHLKVNYTDRMQREAQSARKSYESSLNIMKFVKIALNRARLATEASRINVHQAW